MREEEKDIEQEAREVAGQWYDLMTETKRREAFIDMVVICESEVIGHIKECIKKSLKKEEDKPAALRYLDHQGEDYFKI